MKIYKIRKNELLLKAFPRNMSTASEWLTRFCFNNELTDVAMPMKQFLKLIEAIPSAEIHRGGAGHPYLCHKGLLIVSTSQAIFDEQWLLKETVSEQADDTSAS